MARVRDGFVTAAEAVTMIIIVPLARVRTLTRFLTAQFDRVLVEMILVLSMQMPVVQVIDVVIVPDPSMPAVLAMLVRMVGMRLMFHA